MSRNRNEQGYALLIVLFAIVFITVLTAVFMRGALSNAMQEQTLDKDNLVVVSAEAGVDFYTWNLKQLYNEDQLEAKFNRLVNEYISAKLPVNYEAIQDTIVTDFQTALTAKAASLKAIQETELFSKYTHKLRAATVKKENQDGTVYLLVDGTVRGKYPTDSGDKTNDLQFELRFTFPKVFTADSGTPPKPGAGTGSLVTMPTLKTPKPPAEPVIPAAISRPAAECRPAGNSIENQQHCRQSGISEANYKINKSGVYIDNTVNSWGNVHIENSSMNIRGNFTPASFLLEDTKMAVAGSITAYQSITINKSKLQAAELNNSGGTAKISNTDMDITGKLTFQKSDVENSIIRTNTYQANNEASFNNTDLRVKTKYQSGGARFSNSRIEIGETMNFGGGLFYAEGSSVNIHGDAAAANGSQIYNSLVKIGGSLTHTSTPFLSKNSDILIGGKVSATNGTDFEHVNMIVQGGYTANVYFKLDNTKLAISSALSLTNGGNLENSLLTAGGISSSTPLKLDNSIMATDSLNADILRLDNSQVCAKELSVRDLGMVGSSKIYYQTQSSKPAHTGNNLIKLTPEDYGKKCGIQTGQTPEAPGTIDWKAPIVDKVTY
ncbi:hypothetical protein NCCP2716_29950 [Sporosarcina sp. NCCP-2716]|uniref:hypothetical protein n=1 Tax=Sporosarcina sp. NCCP-2716 TaxID=2943679 RepID=UPI00203CC553|nr:hypothetical protein [Sporosarcina sp. NCCP-2716]GKV70497.1 hypothetical protein NCCP2716_29950 [Sporosarcina sp. NCCP-2716]